jgi:hypothetical protein
MYEDLSAADLRRLAAKCRRFAGTMSDDANVAIFRQMALEYERMASRRDSPSRIRARVLSL